MLECRPELAGVARPAGILPGVAGMSAPVPTFPPFAKIPRLSREVIVTEKIDGTNALVHVTDDGRVLAGSRSQWITPEQDNFGFAAFVAKNAKDLRDLGPGNHYGEWWGSGIQRRYGMNEKRFSLFNVKRWSDARPACCDVVPLLWRGIFDTAEIERVMADLAERGSRAAPGFLRPEGVVVYHLAGGVGFKKTFEKDHEWKGKP